MARMKRMLKLLLIIVVVVIIIYLGVPFVWTLIKTKNPQSAIGAATSPNKTWMSLFSIK